MFLVFVYAILVVPKEQQEWPIGSKCFLRKHLVLVRRFAPNWNQEGCAATPEGADELKLRTGEGRFAPATTIGQTAPAP